MTYIQQAFKGRNDLLTLLLVTIFVAGIFILNFITYLVSTEEDMEATYALLDSFPPVVSLIINLIPFAVLLVLLFIFVKFVNERSIMSLTTSRDKIDWSRLFFSFGLIIMITLVSFGVSYYADPTQVELQFDPMKFGILLIVSLILFPFQIGLEEYLFRGYYMQQIGVMVRNRWFPLILTSVFFGIAHSANPEVAEMGYITMIFYIGTGLLLGIMTLMDEGLELALGFHLGNNLLAALLITSDWSALKTDAIFKYTAAEANTTAMEILIPVLIFYPIILLILAKKYKWSNWTEKLFGKVKEPLAENYKVIE